MKITQYCSVCRQELEMEVVPTDDEEEDGVIWLRCPGCRGFLPKIGAAFAAEAAARQDARDREAAGDPEGGAAGTGNGPAGPEAESPVDDGLSDDLPDDAEEEAEPAPPAGRSRRAPAPPPAPSEPLDEYAALLADADVERAVPYRPWSVYEVGDVLHHLAWDDHGIVVAKESLPGGRRAVKAYFERAGVVRLIEDAAVEP